MGVRTGWAVAAVSALLMGSVFWSGAQEPGAARPQRPAGGFVPGQKRAAVDPAVVAKGKTLFGINCQACHGSDLRGGDLGGPNLLRSQVTLSDQNGELIVPVIQGSRQTQGMPAIGLNLEDSQTVAAYVRSVVGMIGVQGTPPGEEKPLNIVVGNANAGHAYFTAHCASCHASDLTTIASRVTDPKILQQTWLQGGRRAGGGDDSRSAKAMASITLASGETVDGTVVHLDDFLVSVKQSDGATRSFRRSGDVPKVVLNDPLKVHKDLLSVYTDKDIHDVTAYLVTLK